MGIGQSKESISGSLKPQTHSLTSSSNKTTQIKGKMSGKRTSCGSSWTCSEAPPAKKFKEHEDLKLTKNINDFHDDIKIDTPNDDASSALNTDSRAKSDDRLARLMRLLLESLECPVCLDVTDVRFKVCRVGHLVCNKCANKKLPKCPVCRSKFTMDSPLCLRNVIELLKANGVPELVEHRR